MTHDNRNMFLAIALSLAVIIAWQFFYVQPKMEREAAAQQEQQIRSQQAEAQQPTNTVSGPTTGAVPTGAAPTGAAPAAPADAAAVATVEAPRIKIETPDVDGTISLVGGRLDDLKLKNYHVTVEPGSPEVVLLAPVGSKEPYFAETGWAPARGTDVAVPNSSTTWAVEVGEVLGPDSPVTLRWDNGGGLVFRRIISVDDEYMFTVRQTVENNTGAAISLYPYSRVRRIGHVVPQGYWIQHEGMIGVLGEENLQQWTWAHMQDLDPSVDPDSGTRGDFVRFANTKSGWLGMTDKYWATAIVPDWGNGADNVARFSYEAGPGGVPAYQADFRGAAVEIAPGTTGETQTRVFAGAKVTQIVQAYEDELGIDRFNLLIDWGWFYFLTKPMFYLLDFIYGMVGNFGVAILVVTVLLKLLFFPLANRAYASMAKMKALQPKIKALQERFKDDKMKQQQEMMEMYKKEKVNPLAGCIPILIQIPVFFSLYKVIFVSIEMRHAPFFGWIRDLSAPDPTHVFNLFGLLPYDPLAVPIIGHFLAIGIWPIIMGITMWVQMKLNPPPPDPTQAMIFNFMPIIFTFMLASFPSGLVIYWAWNNTLSVTQQYYIMRRNGVKPELWSNITGMFRRKKTEGSA